MKSLTRFLLILFFTGCNQPGSLKKERNNVVDTAISNKSPDTLLLKPGIAIDQQKFDTTANRKIDTTLLINISEEILKHIKNRNYRKFAGFIHPQDNIRFSPYAYIDTAKDKVLSADQFLQLLNQNKQVNWNTSWDAQVPELLTIDEYFKKFIYDVDFLNAELKSINQYHSQGTDLNNIEKLTPAAM